MISEQLTRREIYSYPAAFLLNSASTTLLLICIGLAGRYELAADIGVVQGATLAVFFSFSANARSIILNRTSTEIWRSFFTSRLLLIVPLGIVTYVLGTSVSDAGALLAGMLVLRRCAEWLAEIYLSQMERRRQYQVATSFVVVQAVLLLVAFGSLIYFQDGGGWLLIAWALAPVLLSWRFLREGMRTVSWSGVNWNLLLPHFGSTAINGVGVFVFRAVILSIVGKTIAGSLYTAIALGGVLGSVFAQALGPTLQFHSEAGTRAVLPRWLKLALGVNVLTGVTLVLFGISESSLLTITGQSHFFFEAIGASLIGSTVMVFAQVIRLRFLQEREGVDVFGPDMIINILIVACVPILYGLFGQESLAFLFLVNASLAYVFYFSMEHAKIAEEKRHTAIFSGTATAIVVFLVLPLFFQLSNGIFRNPDLLYDHGARIEYLPIPISLLACYLGILLIGRYERSHVSLWFVFTTFILMLISTLVSTEEATKWQQEKFILMIQFLLPMFAMVLGNMCASLKDDGRLLEKTIFLVVVSVVIVQLVASLIQDIGVLSPDLYVFSIYQHIQYVSTVLCCGYVLALFALSGNPKWRLWLLLTAAPMGIFATYSSSFVAIGALALGLGVFAVFAALRVDPLPRHQAVLFVALVVSGGMLGKEFTGGQMWNSGSVGISLEADGVGGGKIRRYEIGDVLHAWRGRTHELSRSVPLALAGRTHRSERTVYSNVYNYYLDLAISFGIFSVLPALAMVVVSIYRVLRNSRLVCASPALVGLVVVTIYLVLVVNSVSVGMRQLYPGLVIFFLWGLLLSRLQTPGKENRAVTMGRVMDGNGR